MLSVQKILVPVVLAETSRNVVHQAAWLARRFHAEIILLHVVTPFSYPTGVLESGHEITARDLHAHIVQRAQKDLDESAAAGARWDCGHAFAAQRRPGPRNWQVARDRNVDLIVMSTRGEGEFYRFLLGSVTAKVLHETDCPVWTGAHLEDTPAREFSIRRVLCSVDLKPHSRHTVSLAAEMAAAVDATLTLVHITGSVEIFGPGGSHVDPVWKETIVGFAAEEIAKLQQDVGTKPKSSSIAAMSRSC
jgi:nucleotide-binding universal stress UspA family protein